MNSHNKINYTYFILAVYINENNFTRIKKKAKEDKLKTRTGRKQRKEN
jgi:hypothetical protein